MITIDSAVFKSAMRKFTAATHIIACQSAKGRFGMTASAVCSVSAEPPSLLACINRQSSCYEVLNDGVFFSVNLLAEDQSNLAQRFSTRCAEDRFVSEDWAEGPEDVPILVRAAANFICIVTHVIPASSHAIFVGEVVTVREGTSPALLYENGCFGSFSLCS